MQEPTNSKKTNSREAVDDCIMIEEKGRGINDSKKQVEPSAGESTEQIALMTKEQQAAKAIVHLIKASDEKLPSKGGSLIPALVSKFHTCILFMPSGHSWEGNLLK